MPEIPDTLFAHIGAHKTGSTFLQEVFLQYRALLGAAGVHYVPRDAFFRSVTCKNLQWSGNRQASVPVLRTLVDKLLPENQPDAMLVSDEAMAGHILGDAAVKVDCFYRDCDWPVDLLKRGMGTRRTAVIFFIRSIDEFLESCYLQRIRVGSTMSFEEYVAGFDIERISWLPTIEKLRASLGDDDRVWVYDYRALVDDPRGVLGDLFGRMGVVFPTGHQFGRRVNESFAPLQYKAVMGLNRLWPAGKFPAPRRWALKSLRLLRSGAGKRVRFFHANQGEELAERHKRDLDGVRAMGGIVELCGGGVAGGA